jgi:hypothetical protein
MFIYRIRKNSYLFISPDFILEKEAGLGPPFLHLRVKDFDCGLISVFRVKQVTVDVNEEDPSTAIIEIEMHALD